MSPLSYPPLWVVPGGNTAGALATVRTGVLTLAGGNNITLSQNGNAITISAGAGGGGFQSVGLSNIGNTSGDTGLASQQLVLAGGNNITLSGSTNGGSMTITISGGAGGGAGYTAGLSNLGNTAGTTGPVTGQLILAGGNNITLSGSVNGGSATITVSAFNQTAESNTAGISNLGNSAGTSGVISGNQIQLLLAGGNNVTLSQSINGSSATITVSAFNQTVESQTLGMSNLGNSAGTSGVVSAAQVRMLFAGGNNITLSQSLNGASGTITISAPNQTQESNTLGMSNLGNTSGTSGVISGAQLQLLLAGGNNITLSQSINGGSATITVIGGAGGGGAGFTAGLSNIGNTSGDTVTVTGRLVLAGMNNITLSGSSNAGSITVSISGYSPGGVVIGGNTTGTTASITSGTMTIAGGNNITISQAGGNAITISAANAGGFTDSMWFPYNEGVNVVSAMGVGSLHLAAFNAKGEDVQFDRVAFPVQVTNATNSTGSITISMWLGFYTSTGSTLSLAHSSSTTQGITFSGTVNNSIMAGLRLLTMAWTTTIGAGRYWVGVLGRSTSGGANGSVNQAFVSQLNSNFSGILGVASNATAQWPLGFGYYSATTSAMPGSIAFSQINGSASLAARPPSWFAVSRTA